MSEECREQLAGGYAEHQGQLGSGKVIKIDRKGPFIDVEFELKDPSCK